MTYVPPWRSGRIGAQGSGQFPMTQTQMNKIEAAAEALWLDASKERFGTWTNLDEKVKVLWRKSAKAALQAAMDAGD